jgi:hypothetical protein
MIPSFATMHKVPRQHVLPEPLQSHLIILDRYVLLVSLSNLGKNLKSVARRENGHTVHVFISHDHNANAASQ